MLRRGKREWIELKDKPEDLKTQMKFLRGGKGEGGGEADNQGGLGGRGGRESLKHRNPGMKSP